MTSKGQQSASNELKQENENELDNTNKSKQNCDNQMYDINGNILMMHDIIANRIPRNPQHIINDGSDQKYDDDLIATYTDNFQCIIPEISSITPGDYFECKFILNALQWKIKIYPYGIDHSADINDCKQMKLVLYASILSKTSNISQISTKTKIAWLEANKTFIINDKFTTKKHGSPVYTYSNTNIIGINKCTLSITMEILKVHDDNNTSLRVLEDIEQITKQYLLPKLLKRPKARIVITKVINANANNKIIMQQEMKNDNNRDDIIASDTTQCIVPLASIAAHNCFGFKFVLNCLPWKLKFYPRGRSKKEINQMMLQLVASTIDSGAEIISGISVECVILLLETNTIFKLKELFKGKELFCNAESGLYQQSNSCINNLNLCTLSISMNIIDVYDNNGKSLDNLNEIKQITNKFLSTKLTKKQSKKHKHEALQKEYNDLKCKHKLLQSEFRKQSDVIVKLKSGEQCLVCMDNKRCYVCIPCGHLVICGKCKNKIGRKCPICRINCSVHKVFI